jgi:SAM-dependent methyltransferase
MPEAQANHEQIRYWNEQAGPRWVQRQEQLDAQINPLGLAAMQRVDVKPGEHVLDVGCGCGQSALELAERVGPQGSVVGIDISQPMLARARERQNELQMKNLTFLHADAQTHRFEQERFDLIFSRFGVMFFTDPTAAFTNLCTALRPDGRLCFICWQALEKNEWIRIPLMAAAQHMQLPPPPAPGTPGPLSLADPERVRGLLTASGFKDINFEAYEAAVSLGGATSVEEAVDFALAIGPTAMLLRDADPSVRTRVAQAIREALTPYMTPKGLSLNGAAWIVRARASR